MSSDLSPPLSSSKIPSSVDRLRRHHFFLLSAFSAVFFVQTAFFFNEAVFLLQRPIHRLRRHLFFAISFFFSFFSLFFVTTTFDLFLSFPDISSFFGLYFNYFGTILSSFFGLNQTHYFMDNLTPVKHPSSLKHIY